MLRLPVWRPRKKDKENLEAQIEQTGKDYDDAHAAVAQMAREDLHGSDASTVMSVVTGSTSTQEFINSMQSRDALSRTEANAASDAANTLNTSMNRSERLSAIEKQIANLKTAADEKAASAQQAAASAQTQRDSLDQLRAEGETRRAELESQQSQLNGSVAKQAAQTVMLQSQSIPSTASMQPSRPQQLIKTMVAIKGRPGQATTIPIVAATM